MHKRLGDAEIRIGDDTTPYTTKNPVVVEHFFDNSFHESVTCSYSGHVLTIRRNQPRPTYAQILELNTLRGYQVPNLLSTEKDRLSITADTSQDAGSDYRATNVITNLDSRTPCKKYSVADQVVRGPLVDAVGNYADYKSCFASTSNELESDDHKFVFGIDLGQTMFQHAIFL